MLKASLISLFGLFITFLLVYIYLAGRLTFSFPTEPANYFSYQTQAFFQGRLDLVHPTWEHDLSKFNGKLYMYWGPTPILFIFPFILFFGVNFSDVLYTAIIATFTPIFFYLILNQFNQLAWTRLSEIKKNLLTLFLGFGTVYFSVAVRGGVWFTSQIGSTLLAVLAIYFMLDYLLKSKVGSLLLSALFIGLAIWGRNTFIFYLPFLLALLLIKKHQHSHNRLFSLVELINFFGILVIVFILFIVFNYLRFGSALETGYSYQVAASRYVEEKAQYGYLNLAYLPHNFYYNLQNFPTLTNQFPYFNFDGEGNSFILLSPLFLTLILMVRKRFWGQKSLVLLNASIIFSILLIISFQLLFWGTGWFQFSARYMLDAIPLMVLLLAQVVEIIPILLILLLLILSIIFNTLGAMWLGNIKP